MKNLVLAVVVVLIIVVCAGQAYAAVIFDTGTPPDDSYYGYLESNLGYAAQFKLSDSFSLTTIEGHMSGKRWNYDDVRWPQASGTATLVIYGDAFQGIIPGTQLHSQTFFIGPQTGWYGVSGVNWTLPAGDYWVAFEVRDGDTYGGAMDRFVNEPTSGIPPTLVIPNEALITNYGTYADNDNINIGVRAYGNLYGQTAVPEPATIVLFGIGGLATTFLKRRKKIS
ncbi:MAG: PEP-CTERM sorting domain-containing protein [Candidatus Omnitrophota bacterium]|jgi:hypothetical protein